MLWIYRRKAEGGVTCGLAAKQRVPPLGLKVARETYTQHTTLTYAGWKAYVYLYCAFAFAIFNISNHVSHDAIQPRNYSNNSPSTTTISISRIAVSSPSKKNSNNLFSSYTQSIYGSEKNTTHIHTYLHTAPHNSTIANSSSAMVRCLSRSFEM